MNLRHLIVCNYQAGISQSQISRLLGVSQPTCHRIIRLYKTTGTTNSKRKNCGGQNRLPVRTERLLRRASVSNPRATARQLAHEVGGHAEEVDISTIRRSLRRNGISTYRPHMSPSLSPSQCRVRVLWARQHRSWTTENWAHVIFSDETAIDICPSRVQYVRRQPGSRITQAHTASHRPYLQRVMFWSCISVFGPGPLIPITGTMNATKYIDTLQQHLLPYCEALYPERNIIYQQDNAPCHKARVVNEFFAKNHIALLQWPAYSPDLNCIENLWAMLKRKLHATDISSKQQLISEAVYLWENDNDIRQVCQHLIQSMPNRLHECITSKGEYTHY